MVGLDGWEGVRFGVGGSRFGLGPSKISDFKHLRYPILDDSSHSVRVRCPCTLKSARKEDKRKEKGERKEKQETKKERKETPTE